MYKKGEKIKLVGVSAENFKNVFGREMYFEVDFIKAKTKRHPTMVACYPLKEDGTKGTTLYQFLPSEVEKAD